MKIWFLITLLCVFSISAENTYSQSKTVSVELKNVTLKEALQKIENNSDYLFLLMDDTGRILSTKVNASFNDQSIDEILNLLLKDTGLSYSIVNRQITISLKPSTEENSISQSGNSEMIELNQQQQKRIYGTVTDQNGETLPYVSVIIKGTNIGTTTDENGVYEINVSDDVTLIFSYMGFRDYEVSTAGKTRIDVTLLEETVPLEEVVVTGYNTVERRHLASSIESIDLERVVTRPIVKLQEVFSGTVPGVTMLQGSNLPGSVPGNIYIRGISTLQNAEPLVIVDGMEQPLTDIDPNQVASINILKDAAATSMYGSRGANGVIIIETKRGNTGEFKVNINSWLGIHNPIELPDFVNSADFMRLRNEALSYQGQPSLYTEEDIRLAKEGVTPNTDWMKEIMQRQPTSYNTTANISGGGGVGTFNLMLGYIEESGLNRFEGSDKFSARFNTNINIADRFILLADFYAHRLGVDRLRRNNDGHGLYQIAWRMNPTQAVFYEGTDQYILHNDMNPVAFIEKGGTWNNMYDKSIINLRPRYYINDNLNLEGNVSYTIDKSASKWKRLTHKFFDRDGKPVAIWGNEVGAEQNVSQSQLTGRALLNLEKELRDGKDKLYAVAGSEAMSYIFTDYREITKASFFGKLNYSFDDRYLFEGTIRGDGSSKFAPGHQWGFFPAASFGWNAHNEGFMSFLRETGVINNMKFRASWGRIGNENVGPYLWQEVVNTWGWTMRVPNPEFTWEKQEQWNVGLDLAMLKNRLTITADVYNKYSFDLIYSDFPVPPLTGSYYLTSSVNIGEVENKGWELAAKWSDQVGNFSYSIGGILFNNRNQVLKAGYHTTDTLIFKGTNDRIWYRGIPLNNYYGFETDGYFQDQAEIDAADAKFPNTLPGDIRYVDQNGDGILNDKDRVFLGDPDPHYNYSVTLDMHYKQWDFHLLGQGVGKRIGRLGGQEGFPVFVDGASNNLGAPRKYYADNRWTPETPNSRFPRVWTGASTNTYLSDVWLSDASFFRIKSLQLGYTIPKLTNSVRNLRIYFNAQDFLTFTKWEGLEPERDGGNGAYPRMAIYSVGFQVTFL